MERAIKKSFRVRFILPLFEMKIVAGIGPMKTVLVREMRIFGWALLVERFKFGGNEKRPSRKGDGRWVLKLPFG